MRARTEPDAAWPDGLARPGRAVFLWPASAGLVRWVEAEHASAVHSSWSAVRQGAAFAPEAEWTHADPFLAATWEAASQADVAVACVPTRVRARRGLVVPVGPLPLMTLRLALSLAPAALVFLPPRWSPGLQGDAFRERFGYEAEQEAVDRFRSERPGLHFQTVAAARLSGDFSDELVLARNPTTTTVVVAALAGPSGVRVLSTQAL